MQRRRRIDSGTRLVRVRQSGSGSTRWRRILRNVQAMAFDMRIRMSRKVA